MPDFGNQIVKDEEQDPQYEALKAAVLARVANQRQSKSHGKPGLTPTQKKCLDYMGYMLPSALSG